MSDRTFAEPPVGVAGYEVTVLATLSVLRAGGAALLSKTPRAVLVHDRRGVRVFVLDEDPDEEVRALLTRNCARLSDPVD